ncbi:Pyruvate kinase, barrel domain [Azotobacter beijerinckii]|jgi:pyruvate kinase|uniref:pyruvate kinase n=1 Tax=Azotobacter beijerinckii TaxID=170623 RepID=A0A1H7ARC5_9GAMM|nr:Pyruvate kinase, barrel domain [Azotobacter beijerinckii]
MLRRTKIVATLGSASETPEAIEGLVKAGVDVVRLNFSHGKAEEHMARASLVREMAAKHGRFVAILTDLQGPKIRISRFAEGEDNKQLISSIIRNRESSFLSTDYIL